MKTTGSTFWSVLHGSLGFALVSVLSFSIWAFAGGWFRGRGGEPVMYAAIAIAFLGLSGLLLGPLAGGVGRFYRVFLPSFGLYAVLWSAAWFAMPDRRGEWLGAALGCVALVWLARWRMAAKGAWIVLLGVFFLLHTAGYFAGSWAMYDFWLGGFKSGSLGELTRAEAALYGKLSWGLCYGMGLGAGLGLLFYHGRTHEE